MPGLMKREPHGEAADVFGRLDWLFDEWMRMMPFRPMAFPRWLEGGDLIRVEEYREDGALVVRADLPGIDPDKDVELTVAGGMLHIEAERRKEEKREEKGYVRREVRYGSLSRSLPLPEGVTEADISATYKNGVLEIRIPEPKHQEAKKIAISKSY
jgi:HSP20 family protein